MDYQILGLSDPGISRSWEKMIQKVGSVSPRFMVFGLTRCVLLFLRTQKSHIPQAEIYRVIIHHLQLKKNQVLAQCDIWKLINQRAPDRADSKNDPVQCRNVNI